MKLLNDKHREYLSQRCLDWAAKPHPRLRKLLLRLNLKRSLQRIDELKQIREHQLQDSNTYYERYSPPKTANLVYHQLHLFEMFFLEDFAALE